MKVFTSRGVQGSSPHTRGALEPIGGHVDVARIIPAYAGSTDARRSSLTATSDHPRIRGEHSGDREFHHKAGGSSPHTRGAPIALLSFIGVIRIIPAYAGSTGPGATHSVGRKDHPRIRGEHSPLDPSYSKHEGSSPHTRGAREGGESDVAGAGIIPAYAGSTLLFRMGAAQNPDHPRIRGEHVDHAPVEASPAGSSPHTRGARW